MYRILGNSVDIAARHECRDCRIDRICYRSENSHGNDEIGELVMHEIIMCACVYKIITHFYKITLVHTCKVIFVHACMYKMHNDIYANVRYKIHVYIRVHEIMKSHGTSNSCIEVSDIL